MGHGDLGEQHKIIGTVAKIPSFLFHSHSVQSLTSTRTYHGFFLHVNISVLQSFAMMSNMSSSSWPQHACPVCKWMRSVPGLTARSNPRLSLPFQSSNREKKKLAKERGLYVTWGVYVRAMLTTNTYLIINIKTFSEHFLPPGSQSLQSPSSKYYIKSITTVAFNAFHAAFHAAFGAQEGAGINDMYGWVEPCRDYATAPLQMWLLGLLLWRVSTDSTYSLFHFNVVPRLAPPQRSRLS